MVRAPVRSRDGESVSEHAGKHRGRPAQRHRFPTSPGGLFRGRQGLNLALASPRLIGFCGNYLPSRSSIMPKYVIERDLPGAGKLTADQLRGVSQKSCSVLNQLGPDIQWIHSYVTADKIYCLYRAPNESMIREHAKQGGFPANKISEVTSVIEPTTAE